MIFSQRLWHMIQQTLAFKAPKYLYINQETKVFFFNVVLVGSFRFIWIPMLCDHYKYSFNAGIDFRRQSLTSLDVRLWPLDDFRRQSLTSLDVRLWRLKSISALKGLNRFVCLLCYVCLLLESCIGLLRLKGSTPCTVISVSKHFGAINVPSKLAFCFGCQLPLIRPFKLCVFRARACWLNWYETRIFSYLQDIMCDSLNPNKTESY